MQHLNSTASLEEKQALASSYASATNSAGKTLAETSAAAKDYAANRREGFQPGDRVEIEPGYATVQTFTNNGETLSYLGFVAKVNRNGKTFEIPVSISSLQGRTFAVRAEGTDKPDSVQRKDLLYRFGKQYEIGFEEVETGTGKNKQTVYLRVLNEKITKVLNKTAPYADIAGTYDRDTRKYAVQRSSENFAYAENV